VNRHINAVGRAGFSPAGRPPVGPRSSRGSVTAETAVVLPALTVVLALVLWAVAAITAQLACVDAARTAARALARGEQHAAVRVAAQQAAPSGASVALGTSSDHVVAEVSATVGVTLPAIGRIGVPVHAHAVAAREPASSDAVPIGTVGLGGPPA
jgi:TadE-like protein